VPMMVGGNGPNVTWRLAARFADELNLDWLTPDEVRAALPVIWARCEEIGREPSTLRISVNISRYVLSDAGPSRVELLSAYREVGVNRVMGLLQESAVSDEPLESFASDARAAGCKLAVE
jgi:alkanesulfonate monooxygenase SsuD/methylene tetrahydromethanopterin reductase-like flavin-dependent oxidoreductase (luciferase family)